MRPNKSRLMAAVLLLFATLLVAEWTPMDVAVQDHFYNFRAGKWTVDKSAPIPKFIFYHFPKIAVVAFGLYLILVAHGWRKCRCWTRRQAVYLLVCLAGIPSLISALKATTGVHCPSEIRRYGGDSPYLHLLESIRLPKGERGRCFPAGHASGGFALLGLAFTAASRRSSKIGLAIAMGVGGATGLYQMLKGAHFLSHTLVTMLLAWCVAEFLALLFFKSKPDAALS